MPDKKNLENLYQSDLKPKLSKLDDQRIKVATKVKKFAAFAIIPIGLSIFISVNVTGNELPILAAVGICVWIYFSKINPFWQNYREKFKEEVIREIINFIDNRFTYSPSKKMSLSEFKKTGIFLMRVDRYRGDDHIEGKIDSTHVEFSEVHAEYRTRDNKGRTNYHTIFKGLLFSADFNKNFNVKTYVLTDVAEKMFGFLGTKLQKMNKWRGQLVKLENIEFEKEFAVYSEDQVESRYILSPSLMERMLSFKKQTKKRIQMSFVDTRLYIAVPYRKNLFEPKLFGDIVDFKNIQEYHDDLNLALDLIQTLNLNTRIWTKK